MCLLITFGKRLRYREKFKPCKLNTAIFCLHGRLKGTNILYRGALRVERDSSWTTTRQCTSSVVYVASDAWRFGRGFPPAGPPCRFPVSPRPAFFLQGSNARGGLGDHWESVSHRTTCAGRPRLMTLPDRTKGPRTLGGRRKRGPSPWVPLQVFGLVRGSILSHGTVRLLFTKTRPAGGQTTRLRFGSCRRGIRTRQEMGRYTPTRLLLELGKV